MVGLFESGQLANTEEAMGEYLKALVRMDKLNNTALLSTIQASHTALFLQRSTGLHRKEGCANLYTTAAFGSDANSSCSHP